MLKEIALKLTFLKTIFLAYFIMHEPSKLLKMKFNIWLKNLGSTNAI